MRQARAQQAQALLQVARLKGRFVQLIAPDKESVSFNDAGDRGFAPNNGEEADLHGRAFARG